MKATARRSRTNLVSRQTSVVRFLIACGAVVGGLLVLYLGFASAPIAPSGTVQKPRPATLSGSSAAFPFGPAMIPVQSAEPASQGARSVATTRESALAHQFRTAVSLRDFVRDSIQRPEEGGYFFAMLARHECEIQSVLQNADDVRKADSLRATGTDSRRLEAIKRHQTRCKELNSVLPRDIAAEGLKARDPIITAITNSTGSFLRKDGSLGLNSADGMRASAALVVNTTDPYATDFALRELARRTDRLSLPGDFRPDPSDRVNLGIGLLLAGCAFGADCSRTHPYVEFLCLSLGECSADSLEDVLRHQRFASALTFSDGRFDFQRALKLRDQVVAAIAAGRHEFVSISDQ